MTVDPSITAIERRAEAASIPMAELHRRAETHATTWLRMRKGDVDPKLSTVRKYETALEEMIAERRRNLEALGNASPA